MRYVHPRNFLFDQVPVSLQQVVPTVLSTAYKAVRRIVSDEPIFQTTSARQNLGRMMSWSVDRGFEQAIENGALPFDYSWEDFDRPTGKFLAIRPSHSVVTISLTSTPTKQPRTVVFREQAKRLNCQLDWVDMQDEDHEITGLPHILLLHGYWNDGFAHLAIPRADCNYDFSYRTENLFNLPHASSEAGPPPEGPDGDFDAIELLKEDIDRWRKDQ
ncbi:hypothetical protein [Hyphomonas oceanitis]|uniref:Uncharacterized protein n=1 Tax=Hyphomonas oceanitis SCH89 TaxID=1280953 RepID=A0A059G6Z4_9PROT|nr:hypothetical protein [Hyphomonas oceanitis]KDA02596.1 hypothetical protein HOC_09124 [Hyphomonas oceanitis SCH89]